MSRTPSLIATLLCVLFAPALASAQEPFSPLVPRGSVRLGIRGEYSSFSSRYGMWAEGAASTGGLEQLSDDFSGPAGAGVFPMMRGLEDAVRSASGEAFTMSLGSMASVMEKSSVRVPLSLDAGVFDWLTVGTVVPFVQRETEFSFTFVADSAGANAGFSPGLADAGVVSGFLSGLQGSVSAYDSFRARSCLTDPSSPTCQDATALLADARTFQSALSAMYGSMFAPIGSSSAGMALQARLVMLAEAFQAAGVTGMPAAVPLADVPLTTEEFHSLVTDPVFGIAATHPLDKWKPLWALGDIEVRIDGRLLESGEPEGAHHVVAGAGAVVRLPTGMQDDPANFLDMGTGDAQPDVEVRGWMNGRWGGRLGLWADVRYGVQMKGTTERRAFDPDVTFAPFESQLRLDWDPGDYQFLELSPWFQVAETMRLLAGYRYVRKGQDAFAVAVAEVVEETAAGVDRDGTRGVGTRRGARERTDVDAWKGARPFSTMPDPEILVPESSASSSRVMLGLVYNRAASVRDGIRGNPLEIRIVFREVVGGSGGNVPNARSLEAGFRFFVGVWGG